jgi:hypothetical protein
MALGTLSCPLTAAFKSVPDEAVRMIKSTELDLEFLH